jgi:hypothetical protein
MADVFDMLEHEWARLREDRAASRRLRDVCAAAGGARSLAGVERYVRTAGPEDADRVLLALVRRAVAGDDLAARVLLQLLLPGTRALARRWWALGDADERAAAAVAAVYHRIRRYPRARRRGGVAANVLLDAATELRRAVPKVVALPSADPAAHLRPVAARPDDRPDHPALELTELLREAVAAGVVGREDAELIARSRIGGQRVADIAARRGLRPRTLWARRQRAESALATALAAS